MGDRFFSYKITSEFYENWNASTKITLLSTKTGPNSSKIISDSTNVGNWVEISEFTRINSTSKPFSDNSDMCYTTLVIKG